jgi:hypothetical protein
MHAVFADSVDGIHRVLADGVEASIPAHAPKSYQVKNYYRRVANLAIEPSQTLPHML